MTGLSGEYDLIYENNNTVLNNTKRCQQMDQINSSRAQICCMKRNYLLLWRYSSCGISHSLLPMFLPSLERDKVVQNHVRSITKSNEELQPRAINQECNMLCCCRD
jgi:hypothetical protein